jgi:hypothetical protein
LLISPQPESGEAPVNSYTLLAIRFVLGLAFAVVLTRLFVGRIEPVMVVGLAIFLVGMSYVSAYFRKRKSRP